MVAGLQVTSRSGFALGIVALFLAVDLCLAVADWGHFQRAYLKELIAIAISAGARFALAYLLMWALVLHAGHRRREDWPHAILLSVLIPIVAFMNVLVVGRLVERFLE